MRRRRVLLGAAAFLLPAGCSASRPSVTAVPSLPPLTYAASGLADLYALTWVKGSSPAVVVTRTGGRRLGPPRRRPAAGWETLSGLAVIAVTEVDGWALMVEETASPIGATDDVIGKLSKGTRLVLFSHNSQAADRFVLAEDGTILVDFDPGYPPDRSGTRPDLLIPDMRAVGLDPFTALPEPAALALARRLTGIALTRPLVQDRSYQPATVITPTSDDTDERLRRPAY
jgi:hypothetical protein